MAIPYEYSSLKSIRPVAVPHPMTTALSESRGADEEKIRHRSGESFSHTFLYTEQNGSLFSLPGKEYLCTVDAA